MRQALVLGAAGFLGRHVARALACAGFDVTGMGHGFLPSEVQLDWGISQWSECDVNLDTLVSYTGSPELIVQCAGSGSVSFSLTNPMDDYNRSVSTTLAALEYIRRYAPSCRLVLPSSAAVYGVVHSLPIAPDLPRRPVSPYGVHKGIAEELCESYGAHWGVKVAIVRLFSIYGTGLRKQLLWDACCKIRSGEPHFMGTGRELRDWLHVSDASRLLLIAADHANQYCPIVNGGTARSVSVAEIVGQLSRILQSSMAPQFSGRDRGGDPPNYEANIDGARSWGWRPEKELETELHRYVDWFLAQ